MWGSHILNDIYDYQQNKSQGYFFFLHFPDRRLESHTSYCVIWTRADGTKKYNLWAYRTDPKFQAFKNTVLAEASMQEPLPQSSGSFLSGIYFLPKE